MQCNTYNSNPTQIKLYPKPSQYQLVSSICCAYYMMHAMLCNAMQKKPKNHAQRDKVSSPGLMVSEPMVRYQTVTPRVFKPS